MSFLSGLFLWALPLAAIPVAIHLWNRRRKQVVPWGAMSLLLDSAPRRRRIFQISDLLLLILRTLAVAAIVLAFALPQVRSSLFSKLPSGRDVVLIVDASLSTGRLQQGVPVLAQIKERAGAFLRGLDEADQVRLMIAAASPRWMPGSGADRTFSTKAQVNEQLAALEPTLATANIPACFQAALAAKPAAEATSRTVILFTDGVEHGWSPEAGSRWQPVQSLAALSPIPVGISVVTLDDPTEPFKNLAVASVATSRTRVAVGEPVSLVAQIRNTGALPCPAASLKWMLDGENLGESPVPQLQAGQSTDVTYECNCDHSGSHRVSCALSIEDHLPDDNRASVVLSAAEGIPVLICRHAKEEQPGQLPEPDFLRLAIGGGRGSQKSAAFKHAVIDVAELHGADLSQYRCVILDDVVPAASELPALVKFAMAGGGLWIIAGEQVDREAWNKTLHRDGNLVSVSLEERRAVTDDNAEPFSIHPPAAGHPATRLLGDTKQLDIDDVKIKRYWQLGAAQSAERVTNLLESGTGEALATEELVGAGHVIVQALPCDSRWSNLPLCQVFVPLALEWMWHLTQPAAIEHNLDPGSPIIVDVPKTAGPISMTLKSPFGEPTLLPKESATPGRHRVSRQTEFPGEYAIRWLPEEKSRPDLPYVVRRDGGESQLGRLSIEQKRSLAERAGLRFEGDPLSLPEGKSPAHRQQPLWGYLLLALSALMACELFAALFLTKQRFGSVDSVPGIQSPRAELVYAPRRNSA